MDSIKAPYIIDIGKGKKRLVFVGCEHNNDPLHPQYAKIDSLASALNPEVVFNEGGQIGDTIHYQSLQEAARENGETGALKYCADRLGIRMINGDIPFSAELELTGKRHPVQDLFLYYAMERFVIPYKYGAYAGTPFQEVFTEKTLPYFRKHHFPLASGVQDYDDFLRLYKAATMQDFNISTVDIEAFDYINDNCHFCAVGRSSKMVRDSMLFDKINSAFRTNDRIMVCFGHGHALALEPALQTMMQNF